MTALQAADVCRYEFAFQHQIDDDVGLSQLGDTRPQRTHLNSVALFGAPFLRDCLFLGWNKLNHPDAVPESPFSTSITMLEQAG